MNARTLPLLDLIVVLAKMSIGKGDITVFLFLIHFFR